MSATTQMAEADNSNAYIMTRKQQDVTSSQGDVLLGSCAACPAAQSPCQEDDANPIYDATLAATIALSSLKRSSPAAGVAIAPGAEGLTVTHSFTVSSVQGARDRPLRKSGKQPQAQSWRGLSLALCEATSTGADPAPCQGPVDVYVLCNLQPYGPTKATQQGLIKVSWSEFGLKATCAAAGDIEGTGRLHLEPVARHTRSPTSHRLVALVVHLFTPTASDTEAAGGAPLMDPGHPAVTAQATEGMAGAAVAAQGTQQQGHRRGTQQQGQQQQQQHGQRQQWGTQQPGTQQPGTQQPGTQWGSQQLATQQGATQQAGQHQGTQQEGQAPGTAPSALPAEPQDVLKPGPAVRSEPGHKVALSLVAEAVGGALCALKRVTAGGWGTNRVEARVAPLLPQLADCLLDIIVSAHSPVLLPFACNALQCLEAELGPRLRQQLSHACDQGLKQLNSKRGGKVAKQQAEGQAAAAAAQEEWEGEGEGEGEERDREGAGEEGDGEGEEGERFGGEGEEGGGGSSQIREARYGGGGGDDGGWSDEDGTHLLQPSQSGAAAAAKPTQQHGASQPHGDPHGLHGTEHEDHMGPTWQQQAERGGGQAGVEQEEEEEDVQQRQRRRRQPQQQQQQQAGAGAGGLHEALQHMYGIKPVKRTRQQQQQQQPLPDSDWLF